MGITADIGEHTLAIYCDITNILGQDNEGVDAYDCGFGWCYEHDNNELCDMCSCCPAERNYPDTDAELIEHIIAWFEDHPRAIYPAIRFAIVRAKYKEQLT